MIKYAEGKSVRLGLVWNGREISHTALDVRRLPDPQLTVLTLRQVGGIHIKAKIYHISHISHITYITHITDDLEWERIIPHRAGRELTAWLSVNSVNTKPSGRHVGAYS